MFPSVINTFTIVNPTDRLNSPSHSALHNSLGSVLTQVQTIIGVEGSASVVGSLEYLIKSPASDGGGHVQTANKGGTGQTTFIKGDMFVATSSSVISKLAVGADNLVLKANSSVAAGVQWTSGNTAPTVRTYSSIVTIWNRPSTLSYVVVEVQAGGGGGGGSTTDDLGAGGGGGGGYSRKVVTFANLPIAASVFAGGGGAAGGATGGTGGTGTLSYFGSILSATGGVGGAGSSAGPDYNGGAGGVGIGGDINSTGSGGGAGGLGVSASGVQTVSGAGGGSYFGGGAKGITSNANVAGIAGEDFGGGGGGAMSGAAGDVAGGAGGNGIVIVYEY